MRCKKNNEAFGVGNDVVNSTSKPINPEMFKDDENEKT